MVKVKETQKGYVINDELLFTKDTVDDGYINLMYQIGPKTSAGKADVFKINYPGEYDKDGTYIRVYEDQGELNYVVTAEKEKFAIIQSPDIINNVEIDNVKKWIYTKDQVAKNLDKLEIEGKQIDLKNLNKSD